MATRVSTAASLARARPWRRAALLGWTGQAWGAIGTTALFLGITCWWLTQDRSIPIFDAGLHLTGAFYVYENLDAGHFVHALTLTSPYPPLVYLVGDLGITVAGIGVAPPIIAENFVFVPLLALGCYHVARLAFNRTAGLLAVVFALGSPLITSQFHVFMIDAPETAMVAVSIWAILATDGFTRVGISALAGLAVGLGLLTKEPFVFFVAAPVAVTAIRGRQQAWRGLLAFALVALVVIAPWYGHEFTHVKALGSAALNATGDSALGSEIAPAPLSIANFEWYFWNILNTQLYAPLFAFSVIGWVWAVLGLVRRRPIGRFAPELILGAFVAWLAITETFIRDPRYSMPLLVYLAVFGVGWITRLPRSGRVAAVSVLALACAANVAGSSFGVGSKVRLHLLGSSKSSLQGAGFVTVYSGDGFLVSGPHRDGDMLATLRSLRRSGVRVIVLEPSTVDDPVFSAVGIVALDRIANLQTVSEESVSVASLTPEDAVVHHGSIRPGEPSPCVRLANGTGVWIWLGDPAVPGAISYCPHRVASVTG